MVAAEPAHAAARLAAAETPFDRVHVKLSDGDRTLKRALPLPPPSKSAKQKVRAPKSREEERMMLARAMSLSVRAAEARGEIQTVESGRAGSGGGGGGLSSSGRGGSHRGGSQGGRMQLLQADGSLPAERADHKLWAGASEQGWKVRPKSIRRYLERATSRPHLLFTSPSGTRFTSRHDALMSAEAQSERMCATASAYEEGGGEERAAMAVEAESDDEEEEGTESEVVAGSLLYDTLQFEATKASHATFVAATLAGHGGESDSSDDDEGVEPKERCMIWGCKRQLLRCFGVKTEIGSSVGCAESAHVLCAACLVRWWAAQNQLRVAKGLEPLHRKVCPCCKSELRLTGEMRGDVRFHMGLLKVPGTWSGE